MSDIQKIASYCLWLQRELLECVYGPYISKATECGIEIRAIGIHGYDISQQAIEHRLQKLDLISYIEYHSDKNGPYAEILYTSILNGEQ